MLELLSKNDKQWRINALAICRNKDLADDIVQEMYLVLLKRSPDVSKLTHGYVNRTIINVYKDHLKAKKLQTVDLDKESYRIADEQIEDVFCDKDLSVLDKANKLNEQDKQTLISAYDSPIRQIADSIGVNYTKVHRNLEKSRREVLGDDYDTEYNNRRCKYKKIG